MNIEYEISADFLDYFFNHTRNIDKDTTCDDIIYNTFEKWVNEMIENEEGQRVLDEIINHL